MPNYVGKCENLLQCEDVCNSLATAWKGLKYGVGKDIYAARNVVEAIVISTSSSTNLWVVGSCVGFKRRALRRAFHHKQLLDANEKGEWWVKGDRIIQKYALAKNIQALVAKWYFEETKVSPNKKDVLHHWVGIKNWETHVAHFFQESGASCYSNLELILFLFWT
jgi:hypothetical protein